VAAAPPLLLPLLFLMEELPALLLVNIGEILAWKPSCESGKAPQLPMIITMVSTISVWWA
jgi:hypothetical protein